MDKEIIHNQYNSNKNILKTSKRNLHKLQLVQNFAARVVLGLRKFDHISQGRRSLRWLDVTEKVLFNDLVLAFKCVNGLAPDYLGKYFVKRSAVHNKDTRGCNNFCGAPM